MYVSSLSSYTISYPTGGGCENLGWSSLIDSLIASLHIIGEVLYMCVLLNLQEIFTSCSFSQLLFVQIQLLYIQYNVQLAAWYIIKVLCILQTVLY